QADRPAPGTRKRSRSRTEGQEKVDVAASCRSASLVRRPLATRLRALRRRPRESQVRFEISAPGAIVTVPKFQSLRDLNLHSICRVSPPIYDFYCGTRGSTARAPRHMVMERPTGIEPVASAWEAEVLPLYEGRVSCPTNQAYQTCQTTWRAGLESR